MTKDAPAHAMVVGSPARQVGWSAATGAASSRRGAAAGSAPTGQRPTSNGTESSSPMARPRVTSSPPSMGGGRVRAPLHQRGRIDMAAATPGAGSAPGDRSKAPISGRPANSRSILDNSIARRGTLALWDACWTFATAVVLGVRLDFTVSDIQWRSTLRYLVISMVALVAFGYLTKFYRGRFRVGSFDEVTDLAGQFAIVGVATALLFTLVDPVLPRSIPVLVPPIALVSAAAGRWLFRTYRNRNAPTYQGPVKRALVYGAGDAGYPGSVVVTSSMTFAATTNAITYCGATPVFVDSDESGNVDPALLEQAVADQLAQGADVSAIVPVDLLGKVADHAAIAAIAAAHDIPLDRRRRRVARRHPRRPTGRLRWRAARSCRSTATRS